MSEFYVCLNNLRNEVNAYGLEWLENIPMVKWAQAFLPKVHFNVKYISIPIGLNWLRTNTHELPIKWWSISQYKWCTPNELNLEVMNNCFLLFPYYIPFLIVTKIITQLECMVILPLIHNMCLKGEWTSLMVMRLHILVVTNLKWV